MLAFEAAAGSAVELSALDIVLWGVLPYVMVVVLVGGLIWRYKYDQFGWTTRSSQLYESRLLRIASPLFHFGLLAVIAGHFGCGPPWRAFLRASTGTTTARPWPRGSARCLSSSLISRRWRRPRSRSTCTPW